MSRLISALRRLIARARATLLHILAERAERLSMDAAVALAYLARERRAAVAKFDRAEQELIDDVHELSEKAAAARQRVEDFLAQL